MGHATNIITGLSVGLESTGLPVIVISFGIITSYYLGEATGIHDNKGRMIGGLYGNVCIRRLCSQYERIWAYR